MGGVSFHSGQGLMTRAETARPLIRVFNTEQMALTPDKQLIVDRS